MYVSAKLGLLMNNNPFQCDERMEWMKLAEKSGWIQLQWELPRDQPQCKNLAGILWENVILPAYPGIIDVAFIDEWKHTFISLYMFESN